MLSLAVVAEHVGGAVPVDVSPLGVGASMAAPSFADLAHVFEFSVAFANHDPVIALGVIADHIGLAIAINIGPLGI